MVATLNWLVKCHQSADFYIWVWWASFWRKFPHSSRCYQRGRSFFLYDGTNWGNFSRTKSLKKSTKLLSEHFLLVSLSVCSSMSSFWQSSWLSSTAKSKGWANDFSLILFCLKSGNLFANSSRSFCILAPYLMQSRSGNSSFPVVDTWNGSMWLYATERGKVPIYSQKHKYALTAYSLADLFLVVLSSDQTDAM